MQDERSDAESNASTTSTLIGEPHREKPESMKGGLDVASITLVL